MLDISLKTQIGNHPLNAQVELQYI